MSDIGRYLSFTAMPGESTVSCKLRSKVETVAGRVHPGSRALPLVQLLVILAALGWAQGRSGMPPRFEDYPVQEVFAGVPAAPKLTTPLARRYANEIREGVDNGYGVFRDGKEEKGPNFAGHLIVIQWACGSPCMRMAMVDARSGEVCYPPIAINGIGARSFDLPLLTFPGEVPQNPQVDFRLNSTLMVIRATPDRAWRHPAYTYYFLWQQNRWRLLRRTPLLKP